MTQSSLAALAAVSLLLLQDVSPAFAEMPRIDEITWQAYGPESFEKFRENQQPTLVFCRAAWCPTCVLMETTLLKGKNLRAYVIENKIAMVKVDYTDRSKVAVEFMKAHNVKAVPALLYFPARKDVEPTIQLDITTESSLLKLLGSNPTDE